MPSRATRPDDPATDDEWQEAVDAAWALLLLHSAGLLGLVTLGPEVDLRRCDEILKEGRLRGFAPKPDAVDRYFVAMVA